MPLRSDIKKVLVIGSGPIVIGQAAEFDYAGTQACRALKQEGLEVVLINSNPATIMTDKHMADKIYIEPLTLDVVKRVIEIEKPDSVLSNLGGQTGLTLSMELAECGFLAEHNVKLLGSNPETIHKAEDRQAFKDTMEKIGQPCIPSKVVETVEDAMDFAEVIHYPVIVRPAFTLGGTGGDLLAIPELAEIGAKYGKSAAQTVIRWHIQRGVVVLPKSTHADRIRQNIDVFDFVLSDDDMAAISAMDTGKRNSADPDNFDF